MTRRLRRVLALALIAVALSGAPAFAEGQPPWLRAASANFVVYSDAGEERAREIAERLEAFRTLLLAVFPSAKPAQADRLVVMAFRDDEGFTPFKPLYGGKPTSRSGIFLPSRERSLVVLNAAAYDSSSRVIFHEYTHRAIALREEPMPLWLNEGLAELYSTAEAAGSVAEIGAPIDSHLRQLRQRAMMPLEDLFAVTPESPEYNELSKQTVFYAQTWLFVHYWMLGQGEAGRARLESFAARLGRGEPLREAFTAAFGADMATIAKELRGYAQRPMLGRATVGFKQAAAASVAVEAVPEAELAFHFGLVLTLEQRHDEAEPHYRRAQALDPASSLPYEGLGLGALLQGKLEDARASFAEAIKRDSRSYRANYYFAHASIQLGDSAEGPVREALERAVEINPAFAEPYPMLSLIARREGDYPAALSWARRGVEVAPQDGDSRLALGFAQAANRQYDAARASLRHVLGTEENAAVRASAKVALDSLDRYTAAAGAASGAPEARLDVPLGIFEDLPTFLYLASAGVRGRVERITCSGPAMTVHLKVGNRQLAYSNPHGENVVFFTLNHGSVETITCDERIGREAIVQLEPVRGRAEAGLLKGIIFLAPAPSAGPGTAGAT